MLVSSLIAKDSAAQVVIDTAAMAKQAADASAAAVDAAAVAAADADAVAAAADAEAVAAAAAAAAAAAVAAEEAAEKQKAREARMMAAMQQAAEESAARKAMAAAAAAAPPTEAAPPYSEWAFPPWRRRHAMASSHEVCLPRLQSPRWRQLAACRSPRPRSRGKPPRRPSPPLVPPRPTKLHPASSPQVPPPWRPGARHAPQRLIA